MRTTRYIPHVEPVSVVVELAGEDHGVIEFVAARRVAAKIADIGNGGIDRAAAGDHVADVAAIGVARVLREDRHARLKGRIRARDVARAGAWAAAFVVPVEDAELRPPVELVVQLKLELALDIVLVNDLALVRPSFAGHRVDVEVVQVAAGLFFFGSGQPELDIVAEGARDGALDQVAVVVGIFRPDLGVGLLGRPHRDDVDRAADGVASIKGALRTAQNLDAVDEERALAGFGGGRGVDAVAVDGDAAIGGVDVGQAADAAQAELVRRLGVLEAGGEVGDILNGVEADQVALGAGEGGDGDRDVLQVLLALFSGDHQFPDVRAAVGVRRRRRGGVGSRRGIGAAGRHGHCAQRARNQQDLLVHSSSPVQLCRRIVRQSP